MIGRTSGDSITLLRRATGSLARATDLACSAGQVIGLLLVVAGVVQVLREALVSGLWFLLIGWLLTRAAEQARGAAARRAHGRRVAVGEIIDPRLPAGPPSMPVAEFVHEHVVRRGQRALLVVDGGRLLGLVSLSDARTLPRAAWASTPVGRIMTTAPLLTVSPRTPVDEALRLLSGSALHQVPVVEDGRPVGLLGRADLLRFLEVHESRPALEARSGARAGREGPARGGQAVGSAPRRRPGVPRPRRAGGGGPRTSCHAPRGR
jgi:CBS domain-containing protein